MDMDGYGYDLPYPWILYLYFKRRAKLFPKHLDAFQHSTLLEKFLTCIFFICSGLRFKRKYYILFFKIRLKYCIRESMDTWIWIWMDMDTRSMDMDMDMDI